MAPAPPTGQVASAQIATTLFLIGDAGGTRPTGDRTLSELSRQGREATRGSAIVFLGDNVYPAGIPDSADPSWAEARRRLLAQAAVADSTGLAVFFVPGNHDWAKHGRDGWAAVQRADLLLEEYARANGVRVRQLPSRGCPGPATVRVGRFRVVALDTHWWLHRGPRPGAEDGVRSTLPDPEVDCATQEAGQVTEALAVMFAQAGDRLDVVVGHHPLESHGEHGGYHPLLQWLLPAVPIAIPWGWLPIGWLYPLGRQVLVRSPQDQSSAAHRRMRAAVEGTFTDRQPFLYAAGHEHALEVLRYGAGRYYLVSGAGMEHHGTAVGKSDSTAFRSSRPGFMRVDLLRDGRIRLGVTIIDRADRAREVYQAWLDSSQP